MKRKIHLGESRTISPLKGKGEGSSFENNGGGSDMNLINLNQIANKAKEDKIKRKEGIKAVSMRLRPFAIDGILKEDLNIVLQRQDVQKQINRDLQLGKYTVGTHTIPQKGYNDQTIPHIHGKKSYFSELNNREQKMKQLLMYKQFASLHKEEESDREDQAAPQNIPQDSSQFQTNKRGSLQSAESDEDHKYVKYVWNKKTKRLEKKDLRESNLEKIDKRKFENFQKVNLKSKVLCQQTENYLNSSILGEYSFDEIQREMLYGISDSKNDLVQNDYLGKMSSSPQKKNQSRLHHGSIDSRQNQNTGLYNKTGYGNLYNYRAQSQIAPQAKISQPFNQSLVEQKLAMIKLVLRGEDGDDSHDLSVFSPETMISKTTKNATTLVDTKEFFMRKKLQSIQLSNRKTIQSQREKLKSGVNYLNVVLLPELQTKVAPMSLKKVNIKQKSTRGGGLNQTGMSFKPMSMDESLHNTNISVRLRMQKDNKMATINTTTESLNNGNHNVQVLMDSLDLSAVMTNTNLNIQELATMTLTPAALDFSTGARKVTDKNVVVTAEDPTLQSTVVFNNIKGHQNPKNAQDTSKNETMIGASSRIKKSDEMDDYEDSSLFAIQISRSPTKQFNDTSRFTIDQKLKESAQQQSSRRNQSDRTQGNKEKAFIHQVPLQDFQLEQWKNAYKTNKLATRHFYTGSTFINLDK